jgi:hypothetical protein
VRYGNDVIDARDGEADQVDCGPGLDRATADPADVVAATCEVVEQGGAGGGTGTSTGTGTGTGTGAGGSPRAEGTLAVAGRPTLRAVLCRGLTLKVTGGRPGKATSTALLGGARSRPRPSACRPPAGRRNFAIRYVTEYRYDAPVTDNLNAVRVRPASDSTQRCDEFLLRTDPEARIQRHQDYFGTEVLEFGSRRRTTT